MVVNGRAHARCATNKIASIRRRTLVNPEIRTTRTITTRRIEFLRRKMNLINVAVVMRDATWKQKE